MFVLTCIDLLICTISRASLKSLTFYVLPAFTCSIPSFILNKWDTSPLHLNPYLNATDLLSPCKLKKNKQNKTQKQKTQILFCRNTVLKCKLWKQLQCVIMIFIRTALYIWGRLTRLDRNCFFGSVQ